MSKSFILTGELTESDLVVLAILFIYFFQSGEKLHPKLTYNFPGERRITKLFENWLTLAES